MTDQKSAEATAMLRIWDLPTRVFHWALVLLVLTSFVTAEGGWPDVPLPAAGVVPHMRIHIWCGIATLVLVLFRIGWGFAGSATARFAKFVRGPGPIWTYARSLFRRPPMFVAGHNPLGALMIVALLLALLVQAITGLFSKDPDDYLDIAVGPLHNRVSEATGHFMTHLHHQGHEIVEFLVYTHILAVVLYWLVLRENLIGAMFSGQRSLPPNTSRPPDAAFAGNGRAAVVFAVAAVLVWAALRYFPG